MSENKTGTPIKPAKKSDTPTFDSLPPNEQEAIMYYIKTKVRERYNQIKEDNYLMPGRVDGPKIDFSDPEDTSAIREYEAQQFSKNLVMKAEVLAEYDIWATKERNIEALMENPKISRALAETIESVLNLNDGIAENDSLAISGLTRGWRTIDNNQFLSTESSNELLTHIVDALETDEKMPLEKVANLREELAGKISATDIITDKLGQIDDVGVQDLPKVAQQKADIAR